MTTPQDPQYRDLEPRRPVRPPRGARRGDWMLETARFVVLAFILVALWVVFGAVRDAQDAVRNSTAEVLVNRETGYQNRALTCLAISRQRAAAASLTAEPLPAPCRDPRVLRYYTPWTPPPGRAGAP